MNAPATQPNTIEINASMNPESEVFAQHISRRFNEELGSLRNRVMRMGGLVEEQLQRAINAVINRDSELGLKVARDDYKVNRLEVSIDEECCRILATRAPAAMDLRLIVAVIKTITDLERVGDEAEKVGFLASRLASMEQPEDGYRELSTLARHVEQSLHMALDAFSRLDTGAAVKLAEFDQQIDEEYNGIARECMARMAEDPTTIKRGMNVMWVARALERIGDHAKNIGEYVIYLVHGKDVRHTDIEDIRETIADK